MRLPFSIKLKFHAMLMRRVHHCTIQFHIKFEKDCKFASHLQFRNGTPILNQTEISYYVVATCSLLYATVSFDIWDAGKWKSHLWFHKWDSDFQSNRYFIWHCGLVFTIVHYNFISNLGMAVNLSSFLNFSIVTPIDETGIVCDVVATRSLLYSTASYEIFIGLWTKVKVLFF